MTSCALWLENAEAYITQEVAIFVHVYGRVYVCLTLCRSCGVVPESLTVGKVGEEKGDGEVGGVTPDAEGGGEGW